MSSKTTWANLVYRVGDEERLTQYLDGDTSGSHPNFDNALVIADGMVRSRITTRYTTASYDALDSSTIPPLLRFHIESLLLDVATSSDDGRPASIGNYAGMASTWLEDVQAGKANVPELTELSTNLLNSLGGSIVRTGSPQELTFDRKNVSQNYNARDRRI